MLWISFLWRWKRAVAGVMLAAAVLGAVVFLRYDAVRDIKAADRYRNSKEAFDTLKDIQNAPTYTNPDDARRWLREYSTGR